MLLGYGFLLGLLATVALMQLIDALGLSQSFVFIAAMLGLLTALGVWLSRGASRPGGDEDFAPGWQSQAAWPRIVFAVVLVLILVRLASLGLEIYWRPLFPWDAWTVWAVKSRVWFELKQLVPFVDSSTWLNHPGQFYTVEGWYYPATVPLIATWAGLGLGRWDSSLVNLPWLLCAIALALGFYGQSRVWGISPLVSLIFTYLLISLPLLNAHVALAGYADLWLATTYGLAGMAFLQWLRTRDRRQGILALLLALACATIKVEGATWMLTFLPALLIACLPPMIALAVFGLALGGAVIWWLTGGFTLQIPQLGMVVLTPELIQIPFIGRFELTVEIDWQPFIANFLVLGNWHLLWFLAIAIVIIASPRIIKQRPLLAGGVLILSGFLMLSVLFFFTSAASWATDYTALNRLFMHMVPLLMFYLLTLIHDYTMANPVAVMKKNKS